MSSSPKDRLQSLPPEILTIIFGNVEIQDLYSLSLVCPKFHETIKGNKMMFRSVYLHILDDPSKQIVGDTWDWEEEVHVFSRFRRLLSSASTHKQERQSQITSVLDSIMKLTRFAIPKSDESRNIKFIRKQFHQHGIYVSNPNIDAFCCQSELFCRAHLPIQPTTDVTYPSFDVRQASAKLHVLLGSPITRMPRTMYDPIYPYAISKVYDLRNHTPETLWGPYLPDGEASVDWEKMEAIMVILGHNVRDFAVRNDDGSKNPLYSFEWDGLAANSYVHRPLSRSVKPEESEMVDFKDPYNVTGSWMRIVTFLDFHELFHYNFSGPPPPPGVPRPAHSTREACRLIMMELRATRCEKPGSEDGQDFPVVYFTGSAYSMHHSLDPNANSSLTGSVRQTKEGEIRWTTLSIYGGEERWKSECIQVGGINSARGVLGHWFDKDWDVTGPAGPTAFWKISDDIDDPSQRSRASAEMTSDEEEDDEDDDAGFIPPVPEDSAEGNAGESNDGNGNDAGENDASDSDQEFQDMANEIMLRYAEEIAEARASRST